MDRRRFHLRPPPYTDRIAASSASPTRVSGHGPPIPHPLVDDILPPPRRNPSFSIRGSTSVSSILQTPPPVMVAANRFADEASIAPVFSKSVPCFGNGSSGAASQSPPSPPTSQNHASAQAADVAALFASAASSATPGRSRRLPLKRIENSAQRQVALCKRRNRLFRKAHEVSVLCEATVGIIIFSSSGKVSEFCSADTSMPEVIQRYHNTNSNANSHIMVEQTIEKWKQKSTQLRNQVSYLKQRQRYIMGEDEMHCSVSDIEDIELTLQRSISKLQMRKMELLHQEIQELATKQNILLKENQKLREKMQEVDIMDRLNMGNPINNASSTTDSIDTTLKLGQQ